VDTKKKRRGWLNPEPARKEEIFAELIRPLRAAEAKLSVSLIF
jgi:hypothetical protein